MGHQEVPVGGGQLGQRSADELAVLLPQQTLGRRLHVPHLDKEVGAAPRPVVQRDGAWIMRDDERMELLPGEVVETRMVRFRTLGCYPLTGAVESEASTLSQIIQETLLTTTSERQGRAIDKDAGGAGMEKKKQEGYF